MSPAKGTANPNGHQKGPWRQWHYPGGDLCAEMFTAAIRLAQPPLKATGRLLEVGCAEFDWLSVAEHSWPGMDLTGLDTRGYSGRSGARGLTQDVRTWVPDVGNAFDTIVSISAIEHIGLGHYGDPVDPDGDIVAMANMRRWLAPDGWCYLDVPYAQAYHVQDTSHRIYDESQLQARLLPGWTVRWRGYAPTNEPRVMSPTYTDAAARKASPDTLVCVCLWLQSSPEN